MTLRMVFITQWYPPEPVDVPESIAQALREQGWEVEVLTGIPNYPTGRVLPGYRAGRPMREIVNELRVQRAPLYPSHDSSTLRRVLNYATWAVASSVFGQRLLRPADVALVYSSPATAALAAMVAKRLWRTPYVLLIQDVWPDSIFASGFLSSAQTRGVHRLVDAFVQRSYAQAAHVVVTSPGMADLLLDRGVPQDKLSVVYNWLPESETAASPHAASQSLRELLSLHPAEKVLLYAGNHGRAQALEGLIDAFSRPETEGGHLVLMGDGLAKADLQVRAANVSRVHFLPSVPRAEAARITRTADVHVVSLADEPLFAVTMPSKVQSGLQAGLPMLVVARGNAANVAEQSGAGVSAEPGNPELIAAAVSRLLQMSEAELDAMGRAGAATYEATMSRHVGAPRLSAILTEASRRRGRTKRRYVSALEGNQK